MLAALGFETGFTHMEWYRKEDGEVVFGEIGARPPGVRVVDMMNFNTDGDVYVGWAEAVVHGRMPAAGATSTTSACISKRARGSGRITAITGLDRLLRGVRRATSCSWTCCRSGPHDVTGGPRTIGDGIVMVRHPELQRVIEMTERFAADLQLYAE